MDPTKAFYLFEHTPENHFYIWTVIAAGTLYYFYARLKLRYEEPLGRLAATYAPHLVTAFWIHGVFFNPSGSMVDASAFGFMNYWATFGSADLLETRLGILGMLILLTAVPLAVGYSTNVWLADRAKGLILPLIAVIAFYVTAFFLRNVAVSYINYGAPSAGDLQVGVVSYIVAAVCVTASATMEFE